MCFIKGICMFSSAIKACKQVCAAPLCVSVIFGLYSESFVCVCSAGVYDEDSQWMTQVNRLQKLIDRLEQKVLSFLVTFSGSS